MRATTYTNYFGYYSLTCYSSYFPEACNLVFSKVNYTTETCTATVKVGGTVYVDDQYIYYVTKWAVTVGIEEYKNIDKASYADDNALDWYDFLINELGFDHVSCLTNSQATEVNVKNALSDMFSQVDGGDIVCFMFSGHGGHRHSSPTEQGYYLCMYDASTRRGDTRGRLFDWEIAPLLNQCRAERILLFFDTCHAGGFHYMIENLQNCQHIFFGGGAKYNGGAYIDKSNKRGCFTQCFLKDAWKNDFSSFAGVKFADPNGQFLNLVDRTYFHYNAHLKAGDDWYQKDPKNQPVFYDYYTDTTIYKYFYLDITGITNPEL